MQTIAIATLKAKLSAELKKVRAGQTLIILDHKTPVAQLAPLVNELHFARKARIAPTYQDLSPLMRTDPIAALEAERSDSW